MARKKSKHPTGQELEILKFLWERSPLAVREVREEMAAAGQELAHTTLITTLGVMEKKGFVVRRKGSGRGHVFAPKVSREDVSQGMVGDLLNRVFEGSASALVLSLLEHEQVDSKEHEELKKAIRRHRKEQSDA
jgi:predicted transcriptional regulator